MLGVVEQLNHEVRGFRLGREGVVAAGERVLLGLTEVPGELQKSVGVQLLVPERQHLVLEKGPVDLGQLIGGR